MKKYSDIISGAVLFVLAAVYYAMATQIKQYNSGLPGIITSDFIPKVYGIAVMVLSAILILICKKEKILLFPVRRIQI